MNKTIAMALLMICSVPSHAKTQSLKETTDWLHDFVQAEGEVFSADGNWYDRYQVIINGCEVTILHDTRDLSCSKPENRDVCGDEHITNNNFKQTFNLKDIDPKRITMDLNDEFRGYTVNLTTLNERPLVAHSVKIGANFFPVNMVESNHDAYLVFRNSEAAERAAKAFHYAVILCGGKPSAF